jgi:transcriptional regulator with XRE-family HTH domain
MNLLDWRKARKMTQGEFAEMIRRSTPTVSRIEAGMQWPDRETMQAIVEATDGAVTANDLLGLPVSE